MNLSLIPQVFAQLPVACSTALPSLVPRLGYKAKLYRTASDGKLGEDLGTRLARTLLACGSCMNQDLCIQVGKNLIRF